jgi:hypothetical protein
MAELLNGSRFNYVLLGSPENANQLVRVVLVAKTSDTPTPGDKAASSPELAKAGDTPDADPADDAADDAPDQSTAEAEQPPAPADQPVKTPQQMLQEMQQRQLQLQQQPGQPGQPGLYPPGRPGAAVPPGQPAPQPDQQQ